MSLVLSLLDFETMKDLSEMGEGTTTPIRHTVQHIHQSETGTRRVFDVELVVNVSYKGELPTKNGQDSKPESQEGK